MCLFYTESVTVSYLSDMFFILILELIFEVNVLYKSTVTIFFCM